MRPYRRISIAALGFAVAIALLATGASRAVADASLTPGGAATLVPLPMGATAVCMDFTPLIGIDPTIGCAGHGGTLDVFSTAAAPDAAASASQLDTSRAAGVDAASGRSPYAVQAPSRGNSGYSSYAENPTGPLNVAAWLDDAICRGGPVTVYAQVTDMSGNYVAGVAVSGYVQYDIGGSSLSFPATDSSGFTSMTFNSGSPRGGYEVVFSIHAQQGGGAPPSNFGLPIAPGGSQGSLSADTSTGCWAP